MQLPRPFAIPAIIAIVAGTLSFGAPRTLWHNDGVSLSHPPGQWAFAFVASLGAVLLALVLANRSARGLALALAALACGFGLTRSLWRVDVTAAAVAHRSVAGTTRVAWTNVSRLEITGDRLLVWPRGGRPVRLDLTALDASDRAPLERTVARRVREASVR